jgi:hypothetical protein
MFDLIASRKVEFVALSGLVVSVLAKVSRVQPRPRMIDFKGDKKFTARLPSEGK